MSVGRRSGPVAIGTMLTKIRILELCVDESVHPGN